MKTVDDYLSLVTSEHADKPNFIASLTALLQPFVDGNAVVSAIPALFDVDVAVGQQLDFVGQWVGISRNLSEPIAGVYFSLDDADLGLDYGYLKGRFDPTAGVVSLDDQTYRLLIYTKIAANVWNGSLADANAILASVFATSPGTHIFLEDNFDMSIDIGITGTLPSALFLALVQNGYFQVKPAAVLINAVTVSPGPIFGLDTNNYNIGGPDYGAFA